MRTSASLTKCSTSTTPSIYSTRRNSRRLSASHRLATKTASEAARHRTHMDEAIATSRTALLAGATGLVGRELLSMLLLAGQQYRSVHVLLRRAAPDIEANAKLTVHQVDFARLPAAFPAVDDVFI